MKNQACLKKERKTKQKEKNSKELENINKKAQRRNKKLSQKVLINNEAEFFFLEILNYDDI